MLDSEQDTLPLLERRRAHLVQVATTLLVAEPSSSIAAIAHAAGVSRTTVHAHFAKRDDLLRAVAYEALGSCETAVARAERSPVGSSDRLRLLVDELITVGPQLSFLWRNPSFDHDPELGARWQQVEHRLSGVVADAEKRGAFRANHPTWWNLMALLGVVYVAAENVYLGRVARLDATDYVLTTLGLEGDES
jgi:AcrR family transcriptional regulator